MTLYANLPIVTPDYTGKFPREWSGTIQQSTPKAQIIRYGADRVSRKVTTLSTNIIANVTIPMQNISPEDKNAIWDIWNDTSKANGYAKTFLWDGYDEEDKTLLKSYVVQFNAPPPVSIGFTIDSISSISLQIVGKPA